MSTPPPPPRIFVMLATEARTAVVLRRGPTKHCACLRWDLLTDQIEEGQWLKDKIHLRRSDISPCGEYLIYFAVDGRFWRESQGAYTAISRVPYFSALRFYPQGDTYGGGGVWSTDDYRAVGVNRGVAELPAQTAVWLGWGDAAVYIPRLIRDGWSLMELERPHVETRSAILRKRGPGGLLLQKKFDGTASPPEEHHTLFSYEGEVLREAPEWDWADFFEDRLLFASRGSLWDARVLNSELQDELLVADLTALSFREVVPPYDRLD